jgi:hypothetical protein
MYEICIRDDMGRWVTWLENVATDKDVQDALDRLPAGTTAADVWVGTTTSYPVETPPAGPVFYVKETLAPAPVLTPEPAPDVTL